MVLRLVSFYFYDGRGVHTTEVFERKGFHSTTKQFNTLMYLHVLNA